MAANRMRGWPQVNAEHLGRNSNLAVLNQLLSWSFVAFCGFVFFLVAFPSYGELKIGGSPNMAPSRLLRMAIMGLIALIMLIKPFRMSLTRQDMPWSRRLNYLVIAFWVWTLPLVLFNSANLGYTLTILKNEIVPVWMSFWMAVALVRREDQVVWLVRMLGAATVVVIGVTILEVVLKRNVFDGLLQVDNLSTSIAFVDDTRDGRYRAKATFQHALVLAHFLISFGLLFVAKGIFHPRPFKEGFLWSILGFVSVGCVYFTNTRSGLAIGGLFLAILLCLRYAVWLSSLRSRLMATLLGLQLLWLPGLAIGVFYFAADLLMGRTADERSSSSSRMLTLIYSFQSIAESPIIGFGNGVGETKGGVSFAMGSMYTVDNLFLLQALVHGLPAALMLMGCIGFSAWRLMPRWQALQNPSDQTALRVGLVFVFTTSLVMYNIYALIDLLELCFVLIGASLCLPGRFDSKAPLPKIRP